MTRGESAVCPCRPGARTTLTDNILHLSAAWVPSALSSFADNPLPQIWSRLLGSQWHNPINKSCFLLLTVVWDPKRENGRKTWQPWLIPMGLSPLVSAGEMRDTTSLFWLKTDFMLFASVYTWRTKLPQLGCDLIYFLHTHWFYQSKLKKPQRDPLAYYSWNWIRSVPLYQSLWCILHQRDWLNLFDACLVGKHPMSCARMVYPLLIANLNLMNQICSENLQSNTPRLDACHLNWACSPKNLTCMVPVCSRWEGFTHHLSLAQ